MKKPHEQEWSHHDDGRDVRITDGMRDVFGPGYDTTMEDFDLAAAAPDMALALLAELRHEVGATRHTDDCWEAPSLACTDRCQNIHAALRKAGVL